MDASRWMDVMDGWMDSWDAIEGRGRGGGDKGGGGGRGGLMAAIQARNGGGGD